MTSQTKYLIALSLKVLISLLFVFSAISKMASYGAFPDLSSFALLLGSTGIIEGSWVCPMAKLIIAFELFLGLAILQPHYLKKIILPAIAFTLLIFCIYLGYQLITTGNQGNCGCMGELVPMSPLAALIKNILTLGLLFIVFRFTPSRTHNEVGLPLFLLFCTNSMVFVLPLQCVGKSSSAQTSAFSEFKRFNTGNIDLSQGRKIVCVFSSDCDHCKEAGKALCQMSQKAGFPDVHVLFLDENKEIPRFFEAVGCSWPYIKLPDPGTFFAQLGKANSPPRVVVLEKGQILGEILNYKGPFPTNELENVLKK